MSQLKDAYERSRKERAAWALKPLVSKYFLNQEARYVHPFRIYGNVWYVGDSWVCVHLIDTGNGLLLIDAGNSGASAMLVNAIWEAGFKPSDVKWIILSHGHLDHIGAALFFRRMFGTKLYLGRPDAEDFLHHPELSLIQDTGNLVDETFAVDQMIEDGLHLDFGGMDFFFRLCPGHTRGVVSLFFDVEGAEGTKRAGYYGGFGFNTLQKAYLDDIGDATHAMRQRYLESLQKVRDEKVELFLANHCVNNDTLVRMAQLRQDPSHNPFLDDKLWKTYLDAKRNELLELMADPAQN